MNFHKDILNELNEISPLVASIPRVNPLSVPENYFKGLSSNILDKIEFSGDESGFAKIASPFQAPDGYFEHISRDILALVKDNAVTAEGEIQKLSPVLAQVQHMNVFETPEGYFNSLPSVILSKVKAVPAKIVTMRKPAILRYAAAAVISGIMGLSLFSIFNNQDASGIAGYSAGVMETAAGIVSANSFDQELKTLSYSDIEHYLEQSGQDVEAALVASATEEPGTLPAADTYLFNENALDDFLNKMNLNN